MERYFPQIQLNGFGPHKQYLLKKARVLVVGAGGLGCPVLQTLNAMGIGTLGISDGDKVALSNLHRQTLYTPEDINTLKTTAAKKWLLKQNPHTQIYTHPPICSTNSIESIRSYDVVVDASDHFPTKYLLNDACVQTARPLVFGAVDRYSGQITTCNWKKSPHLRHLFPSPPLCQTCQQQGILGVVPALIGQFQALEVIKILTNIKRPLAGKLFVIDTLTLTAKIYTYTREMKSKVQTITYKELQDLPEVELIDVREDTERAQGHIGGKHIPCAELQSKLSSLETDKPIVVYCQGGVRSQWAAQLIIERLGTQQVYSLEGGLANLA